jgi:hypothetical protein
LVDFSLQFWMLYDRITEIADGDYDDGCVIYWEGGHHACGYCGLKIVKYWQDATRRKINAFADTVQTTPPPVCQQELRLVCEAAHSFC